MYINIFFVNFSFPSKVSCLLFDTFYVSKKKNIIKDSVLIKDSLQSKTKLYHIDSAIIGDFKYDLM